MPAPPLYFRRLTDRALKPIKSYQLSAGFDLRSPYVRVVPARGSCLVETDLQITVPYGTYGRIAPRSGLALHRKIDVGAGVIDCGFEGGVGVLLFNHSDLDFEVQPGDRIAQLIIEKICMPKLVELKEHKANRDDDDEDEDFDRAPKRGRTERRTLRFGSSGLV